MAGVVKVHAILCFQGLIDGVHIASEMCYSPLCVRRLCTGWQELRVKELEALLHKHRIALRVRSSPHFSFHARAKARLLREQISVSLAQAGRFLLVAMVRRRVIDPLRFGTLHLCPLH